MVKVVYLEAFLSVTQEEREAVIPSFTPFYIKVIYMNENEIKKGNIKLTVFDEFDYHKLKIICDKICELGYECKFIPNGNIVFQEIIQEVI